MVVDSSALLAILFQESDAQIHARALAASGDTRMSAGSYLEAAIVADNSLDATNGRKLNELVTLFSIELTAVTESQSEIARQAYQEFGKGNHPAGLNFGDCFAYALAKELREPLLFKGDDFSKTDIVPALSQNG